MCPVLESSFFFDMGTILPIAQVVAWDSYPLCHYVGNRQTQHLLVPEPHVPVRDTPEKWKPHMPPTLSHSVPNPNLWLTSITSRFLAARTDTHCFGLLVSAVQEGWIKKRLEQQWAYLLYLPWPHVANTNGLQSCKAWSKCDLHFGSETSCRPLSLVLLLYPLIIALATLNSNHWSLRRYPMLTTNRNAFPVPPTMPRIA